MSSSALDARRSDGTWLSRSSPNFRPIPHSQKQFPRCHRPRKMGPSVHWPSIGRLLALIFWISWIPSISALPPGKYPFLLLLHPPNSPKKNVKGLPARQQHTHAHKKKTIFSLRYLPCVTRCRLVIFGPFFTSAHVHRMSAAP